MIIAADAITNNNATSDGSYGILLDATSGNLIQGNNATATNYAIRSKKLIFGLLSAKKHGSAFLRAKILGVPDDLCIARNLVLEGKEKIEVIKEVAKKYHCNLNEILFFGDDFPDAKTKQAAPEIIFSMPHNAPFYLHHLAQIIIPRNGGDHALRLLLDLVLFIQEKHFAQDLIQKAISD